MSVMRRAILCAFFSAGLSAPLGVDIAFAESVRLKAPPPVQYIDRVHPPTYAIAPRSLGLTYGANYFEREAYAGPAKRGQAYHVRRRAT